MKGRALESGEMTPARRALERELRETCKLTGELALGLAHGAATKAQREAWAARLRALADQIEARTDADQPA